MAFLPNVAFPGTAANEGVENLMKQLLQRRIAESENAYRQGQLGIAQSAERRAQELHPFQKQEYQSKAATAKSEQELLPYKIMDLMAKAGKNVALQDVYKMLGLGGSSSTPPVGQFTPINQTQQLPNANPQDQMSQGGQINQSPQQAQLNQGMQGQSNQAQSSQGQYNNIDAKKALGYLTKDLKLGEEIQIKSGDPQKSGLDRFAGSNIGGLKIPDVKTVDIDGIRYSTLPSGTVTAQKIGPNESEKIENETNKAFLVNMSKENAKQVGKWSEEISNSRKLLPTLEIIRDAISNPVYRNMFKNPLFYGKDIDWVKRRTGSKEEQDALATVSAASKNIYSALGEEFKGAFRDFEKKIFDSAIPDPSHDTIQQQESKINTMLALRELMIDRRTKASKIVRDSMGKTSPEDALAKADASIGTKEKVKKIENDFKQSEKEQKKLKLEKNGEVEVIDPSGKIHTILRKHLPAAMKEFKGLKEVTQ